MRVLLKDDLIVLIPESEDETHELEGWRTAHEAHVFCADSLNRHAMELHGLESRALVASRFCANFARQPRSINCPCAHVPTRIS